MKTRKKKPVDPMEKFLSRHHKGCLKVCIFVEPHPCTCGRDEAEKEWLEVRAKLEAKEVTQ